MQSLAEMTNNPYFIESSIVIFCLLISVLLLWAGKRAAIPLLEKLFSKTSINWDNLLIEHKLLWRSLLLIPGILFTNVLPLVPHIAPVLNKPILLFIYLVSISIVYSTIDIVTDLIASIPALSTWPVKGWGQLLKILATVIGVIFIVAMLLDRSPWVLVSGIGAMTAVLMLIFKDTILSFVAGMQIASYDLIRVGDWIEMKSMGADGDVLEISLHTVKVQNFDKTIISIPTHKFLEEPVKNWRGMYTAGGRRIKRSVLIDQSSIRFADSDMISFWQNIDLLRDYLSAKLEDIKKYNESKGIQEQQVPLNGRRLTNLGTFRAYVLEYLKNHPEIRQDLTLIVRHLQPGADKGLPLEIYCFTQKTKWDEYERIQADIFDHILAALPFFKLRAYQRNALVDSRA